MCEGKTGKSRMRVGRRPRIADDSDVVRPSSCAPRPQPHCLRIDPGPRHLTLLRELCDEADASGDLIPDAVLAAIAAEHHCDVVTLDRDFARFTSVRHIRPQI
jgi:predicted nucleic acid-binding protein